MHHNVQIHRGRRYRRYKFESDSSSSDSESNFWTDDNIDNHDIDDSRLYPIMTSKIPTRAPELKEMTSFTVALALWKHVSIPVGRSDMFVNSCNEYSFCRSKVLQLTSVLSLPKRITESIDKYIEKISTEIRLWVSYHFRTVYLNNGSDYFLYYHVNHMIWYPNATINYKETARNLLTSFRLSDVEKYRLLCTYCLKEELEQMSPELYSNNVMDRISFTSHPLIYYWNCYFRNELDKIPLASVSRFAVFGVEISLDRYMVHSHQVDNWPAKEYFFDRLSTEEQMQSAISLIVKYGLKYQKVVLMKLNQHQRLHVYLDIAADIIVNYADDEHDHTEDLLSVWLEVRDLITDRQFVSLFCKLLKIRKGNPDVSLNYIWIHASDSCKNYVINLNERVIIEEVFKWWGNCLDAKFIFRLLSDLNNDIKHTITKKQYFSDCCNLLLSCSKFSIFDRLLKSCFSEMEKLVAFQRNIVFENIEIRERCSSYYRSGDLNGLNTLLTPLLSNSNSMIEYKTDILMSSIGITSCVCHMGSHKKRSTLNKIIADGLPTENLVSEFKKRLIFSTDCVYELLVLIQNDKLNKVEQRINRFLSSEQDKIALKKQLLSSPEKLMKNTFRKYDESWWQALIKWCLGDDKAVEEFKSTLNVDDIFDEILKGCVFKKYDMWHRVSFCSFHPAIEFAAVDRFLKWYFMLANEIKQYKLRRVESWLDVCTISTLLKKKNNRYLALVMNWFFQKNAKQMAKFKKKFKGERVAEVL